jgi:hypothetical protein
MSLTLQSPDGWALRPGSDLSAETKAVRAQKAVAALAAWAGDAEQEQGRQLPMACLLQQSRAAADAAHCSLMEAADAFLH